MNGPIDKVRKIEIKKKAGKRDTQRKREKSNRE